VSHTTDGTRKIFYKRLAVVPLDFPSKAQIILPFQATHIVISNESNKRATLFSFNGTALDGELFKKESPITFDGISEGKMWFKRDGKENDQPGEVRVWAWRK